MIALSMLRPEPHYRRHAFETGLQAAGYRLVKSGHPTTKRDLLVIWNKYGAAESMASTWERCGGTVIVCENGYIGADQHGHQLYAIAVGGHNGSGWHLPEQSNDRLRALKLDLKPWQEGEHIIVCGQRGIGSKEMASPEHWHMQAAQQLRSLTKRHVRVRLHPGNHAPVTRLEDDLQGAHACVVWSSACGVKALTMGVPVFYAAPHWICAKAARHGFAMIGDPLKDDGARERALSNMAYAQWTIAEIETGEPFERLRMPLEEMTW